MLKKIYLVFFVLFCLSIDGTIVSPAKVKTLYASLDPHSVAQHLAFYQLYSDTDEGKIALSHAWGLLTQKNALSFKEISSFAHLHSALPAIVGLVNKQQDSPALELNDQELDLIDQIASSLANRKLKGFRVKSEQEVLALSAQEIDLSRGLLLTELGEKEWRKIQSYESLIDLMALQIRARLAKDSSPEMKIRAINDFIFGEMGFRFPPHSLYAKDIDLYTFLPSVLDSRRGVCLGVSILYICIAQRLDLSLEMITPPGHIYVRHRPLDNDNKEINIETTARGVHIDSEEYLSVETRSLQQRNLKEVIGLAHFNQASVFWKQEEHAKALASYKKAQLYLPEDMLLKELMGYTHLLVGNFDEGKKLLQEVQYHVPEYAVSRDTMAEDYLNGKVDAEGIKALFVYVDETRASILKKRQILEKAIEKYPTFRAGLFHLAVTWLQLHREREALEILQRYHQVESHDPTAEYYLSMLYARRLDYNSAWKHFNLVEEITKKRNYFPKQLKSLRQELSLLSPE